MKGRAILGGWGVDYLIRDGPEFTFRILGLLYPI